MASIETKPCEHSEKIEFILDNMTLQHILAHITTKYSTEEIIITLKKITLYAMIQMLKDTAAEIEGKEPEQKFE